MVCEISELSARRASTLASTTSREVRRSKIRPKSVMLSTRSFFFVGAEPGRGAGEAIKINGKAIEKRAKRRIRNLLRSVMESRCNYGSLSQVDNRM